MDVSIENIEESVEGHTAQAWLHFNGEKIWGPKSCHDNTIRLARALEKADSRFSIPIEPKEHHISKHTRSISVKDWDGNYVIYKLSTDEDMDSLVSAAMDKTKEAGAP